MMMRTRRSKRIAGVGLLSVALQLLASQALALTRTSTPWVNPTPSPTATVSVAPSPPGEPEPEPEPSDEPAPVEERKPRQVTASGAQAGFLAVADPNAIRVGDSATITAEVTNSGDAVLEDATATFTLPYQLSLGSRPGDDLGSISAAGTTSVVFDDIDVEPGGSQAVVMSVLGVHGSGAGPARVIAELVTDDSVLRSRFGITVSGPGLKLKTFSDQKDVEVGDTVDYNVEVTATGDEPLTDVVVTNHIPGELDFVWVELLEGITYRRVGNDLIWSVDTLGASESLLLRWRGEVAKTGRDYLARNVVDATAASLPLVTAEATTSLLIPAGNAPVAPGNGGGNGGGSGSGSGSGTGSGTVSTGSTSTGSSGASGSGVQGSALPAAAPGDGDPLPFTGTNANASLMTAFALMAAGTLLLWGGRDRVVGARPDSAEDELLPWIALMPQGRELWLLVQDLRRKAYGG